MFGTFRQIWRSHLAAQHAIASEMRALRSELANISKQLGAIEANGRSTADDLNQLAAIEAHGRSAAGDLQHLRTALQRMALERQVSDIVAADGRYADPLSLLRHHAQVYSQNGEDGMIAEIFRRIGTRDRVFLEIGIEGGIQNNSRLLLEQGWTGVWVEGNEAHARSAADRFPAAVADGRLKILNAMAAPEGIDALLDAAGLPMEFDFLSLDIDQHTPHVWQALGRRARVACIEYNASVPATLPIEVPYDATQAWNGTNWFGGGLKILELIGREKGLHLVGCDVLGVNAFFVACDEVGDRFRAPFTAEAHYQPPAFSLLGHLGHPASPAGHVWQGKAEDAT